MATFDQVTPLRLMLVSADLEAFKGLCSLLEVLMPNRKDVRLSLTHSATFPDEHGGV